MMTTPKTITKKTTTKTRRRSNSIPRGQTTVQQMRRIAWMMLLVGVATAIAAPGVSAQMSYGKAPLIAKEPDLPPGVGVEQKLGAQVPLDMTFFDHNGTEVSLKDCIGDKPTILILAYFTCPKLCTEVLNGLVSEMKALTRIGLSAGRDYNVITISINPKDSPNFAMMKRQSYLREYDKRSDSENGWWFLTTSQGQGTNLYDAYTKIRTLAEAVGFNYAADNRLAYDEAQKVSDSGDTLKGHQMTESAVRKTKDYIHASTIMILTPGGQVSQYHHGLAPQDYNAEDIRKSLSTASDGKMGSLLTSAALLCFAYDQTNGHYKFVLRGVGLVALPFPFIVGWIAYAAWRRSRSEKKITRGDLPPSAGGLPPVPAGTSNEHSTHTDEVN